jgi:hypothetical protein
LGCKSLQAVDIYYYQFLQFEQMMCLQKTTSGRKNNTYHI